MQPFNAKYIGYKCICCEKEISEGERQKIISLDFVQTWCLMCAFKNNPSNKIIENLLMSV